MYYFWWTVGLGGSKGPSEGGAHELERRGHAWERCGDEQIGCGVEVVGRWVIRVGFGFLAEPFTEAGGLGEGLEGMIMED